MKGTKRHRFGMWLEQFKFLHKWLFLWEARSKSGYALYYNRINGHLVMMSDKRELITPGAKTIPRSS